MFHFFVAITGLAYIDIEKLTEREILCDRYRWPKSGFIPSRAKNRKKYNHIIPLLPAAAYCQ
jgi:hypothetical protein